MPLGRGCRYISAPTAAQAALLAQGESQGSVQSISGATWPPQEQMNPEQLSTLSCEMLGKLLVHLL